MRVAVVCPYDLSRPGGVQHQVEGLVGRLREAGDEAWAVGPGCPTDLGVDTGGTVTIPVNGSASPIALGPSTVRRVRSAVSTADVVHVHEPFVPLVSPAALSSGRPRVLTFHADPPAWARSGYRLAAPALRRLVGSSVCTAVSDVAAAAVRPIAPVEVIPNGLDVASYLPDGDGDPWQVAFLGRDDPRKGLDVLLEAWDEVQAGRPQARLVVGGAHRPGRPGVEFLGRVDDPAKRRLLARSSVLVAPNLGGESFGIVVAEGMAAGCAVVASDLPAFRAVLGDTGILVPPGDPAALSGAIAGLLDEPDRARRLGVEARNRAGRFDWAAVVAAYRSAYLRARSG